jgi:glycerophosphoryl diester phosphodiesterase
MILIAHRMPATVEACAALASRGANVFEVDLQLSGSEVLISHALPLLPGVPYLRSLRHDGWQFSWSAALAGQPLASAFDRLPPGTDLLLDLKTDHGPDAPRLIESLLTSSLDPARCHISSKNWPLLDELARAGFRTWRSVATRAALQQLIEAADHDRSYAVTVRHTFLTPTAMPALTPFGRVIAWTVNDPARAQALEKLGVAGVTSDNPDVFADLARGD